MPTRYLLLVTSCLAALTLASCGSLRLEGGFKQPQELTATARAMPANRSRVADGSPTAASPAPSPTGGLAAATPTRSAASTAARSTTAPTSLATVGRPTPAPAPTAAPTPSPMPTPSPVPTTVEAPACGHPYFPLPSQGYWRYAITTRYEDGEPTPQAPEEMRVVSTESDAGRTIATLSYTFERSDSPSFTYRVDCAYRQGVFCRRAGGVWPNVNRDCTAWDPATPPRGFPLDPLPVQFYLCLPPADALVPGYSWAGPSGSLQGSAGGEGYSTAYTVIGAGPVLFQGHEYEGLKIKQLEVEEVLPGIGGVTIYNKATTRAQKTYTIELARGIGIVRRVATGEINCTSDAPTTRERDETCSALSATEDYELLEFGAR